MNWPGQSPWQNFGDWNHEGPMHGRSQQWRGAPSPWINPPPNFQQPHGPGFQRPRFHPYNGPAKPAVHGSQLFNHPAYNSYAKPAFPQRPTPNFNNLKTVFEAEEAAPKLLSGRVLREEARIRTLQRNDEEPDIERLELTCEVSSQKVEVRWKPPTMLKNVTYRLTCIDLKNAAKKWPVIERTWTQPSCELKLTAGECYCLSLECSSVHDGRVIAHGRKQIRAVFTYDELKKLREKAVQFVTPSCGVQRQVFVCLYRCKPKPYWDEIHHCCNDVMHKYIKDDNGQPANLINGLINGLFFSARLLPNGALPPSSPFGNVRMRINARILLDPAKHNFYFADFYCNYLTHYVTVVVCVKGSETDKYCSSKLLSINPEDNPFLLYIPPQYPDYQPRFSINSSVWVEIYYTEDVPLNWGSFDAIHVTGAGTSKIGGLPNNKSCTKCNLYPPTSKSSVDVDDAEKVGAIADLRDDAVNSTLHVLTHEDHMGIEDVFEDVVVTICELVDNVVENAAATDEVFCKSDERLAAAVERLNRDVAVNSTPSMAGASRILTEFVKWFSEKRDLAANVLRELRSITKTS